MRRFAPRLPRHLVEVARATMFPLDLATSKRRFALIFAVRLFFLVGRRLWLDKCPRLAAALGFQTLLSLIPILALALAVGSALGIDKYIDRVIGLVESGLLPETAAELGARIRAIAASVRPKTLGVVGGVTLAGLAVTLFFNIDQAVNEIFRCSKAPRSFARALQWLALLPFLPAAIGVSIYYAGRLVVLPAFASAAVPLVLTVTTLFFLYWRLPRAKVRARHAIVSAAVAGVLFEALKIGFAIYARRTGAVLSPIYGAMVVLPLFMVWVYVAWLVFLFGAELNASLHEVRHHDTFDGR